MHDVLEILLVVATAFLAVYTAVMAKATRTVALKTASLAEQTRALAAETISANELADRHHQEAMTPCVILDEGVVVSLQHALRLNEGYLRNIGPGIALDIRIWIGDVGEPVRIRPLASNEKYKLIEECTVPIGNQIAPRAPIKLMIMYKNLFGAEAKTTHFGHIGDRVFTTIFDSPPVTKRIIRTVAPVMSGTGAA